ncbi:MAG: hypothetical protein ACFFD2_20940, partial [Promethearchaeota archaeon]
REKLLKESERETKRIRKEKEKVKEANRKNMNQKLQIVGKSTKIQSNRNKYEEKYESNQQEEEIDWSKIIPAGRRKKRAY